MRPRLLHAFSTFQAAGPQVRTVALLNAFGDEYEHAIVALDGHTEARELVEGHVPLRMLEAPPRAGTPATVRAFRGLLKTERPDLVLTYNWGAMDALVAARTRRISIVHHEDGFRPDEVDAFKRRRVLFRRLVLGGVNAIVVPSETLGRISRDVWKLSTAKVIPNGIHVDRFQPSPTVREERRTQLGVTSEALVVGAVGHLRAEKNPGRLLEAFAALPQASHLVFIGDGPERPELERRAAESKVQARVHFLGHQSDPAPWLAAFDLFALPSDTEQMPVALLEAMAAGLAVAATDVGDVRVILPESQGAFVVPKDHPSLGQALVALAEDPALRAGLAQENRARVVRNYSFEGMLEAYRGVWNNALGRG